MLNHQTHAFARAAALALAGALLLTACAEDTPQNDDAAAESFAETTADAGAEGDAEAAEDDAAQEQSTTFTIAGTGDILIHDNVIDEAAVLADDDGYDFVPLMQEVEPLIAGADLAICGMEVPVAPEGVEPVGYPVFAAPEEIAAGLAEIGFDGCSTANNHSYDQGQAGLERTLEVFDEAGLGHIGTARSPEEAARAQLYTLERAGREVTVAHLATTGIHNWSYPPPADEPWRVTDISAEELTAQAAQAREEGADIVVASVHWGDEYVHEPTASQRAYGEELAAGGEIDAVFGGHSHTSQPLEQLEGGPQAEGMWVAWSLGNFLSNQDEACCTMETASGTVAYATVEVEESGASVTAMDWLPVTVDRGPTDDEPHRGIWRLDQLAEGDVPDAVQLSQETIQGRWDRLQEVMSAVSDEQRVGLLREAPPEPTGEEPTVIPRTQ